MAGRLVEKTAMEIQEERSQGEDEITMKEMQRIADNIIKHIETEYDCPSRHPELEFKVPVLDLAVWVEEIDIAAPGLDVQELHSRCCDDDICLPVGEPRAASSLSQYTTPVYRGRVPGRSSNTTSDAQLIQSLRS